MSHKLCCCLSFHFQAAQIGPKKEEKEKVNGRMNKQVLEMNNSQDLIVNSPLQLLHISLKITVL